MLRRYSLLFAILCWLVVPLASCKPVAAGAGEIVHEQQWIVDSIGEDIAEMVTYAGQRQGLKDVSPQNCKLKTIETPGNTSKFTYELTSGESPNQTREFELAGYAWSADNYAPWAVQLLDALKLHSEVPTASDSDDLIAQLSNLDSPTIAHNNEQISAALSEHPLDPSLHEKAALLCATFALRESASCFNDVRPWMNRICAHLSMAKALRGKDAPSNNAKLATATLAVLCARGADCLSSCDTLSNEHQGDLLQSWLRALKIRATGDYRQAALDKATPVEQLAYGRAVADGIGSDYLTDYLSKNRPKGSKIDWLRIGARGVQSVEGGQLYIEPGVSAELSDLATDLRLFKGTAITSWDQVVPDLSLSPTRCFIQDGKPELQAISWPDVAAFHARHFLDSIFQRYDFEHSIWGVPDQASAFAQQAETNYSKIKLFPLVELSFAWINGIKTNDKLAAELARLITDSPQDINSTLWHRIVFCSSNPSSVPGPYSWFVPRLPFGTAYDFYRRLFQNDPEFTLTELDTLNQIDPQNSLVISNWIEAKYPHETYTGEQLAAAYGSLGDYDIGTMESIADAFKKDPSKHAQQMEKIARFKPDWYFELGAVYAKNSQPEKAKEAYELGVKNCRDSVIMSNKCTWLVNYYYDHGQKDKALDLAQQAAEVYSARGLLTLADLYQRMGKLDQAEAHYKKEQERYDDPGALCRFYKNNQAKDPRYKAAYDGMVRSIFPDGMVKIDQSKLAGPPRAGVNITSSSDLTKEHGLHYGDVFVGVNGYAVQNQAQYHFAAELNESPNMEFVVWNGKEYRTVKAVLPDHRWGCGIGDYRRD